jgi:hypothetical protein
MKSSRLLLMLLLALSTCPAFAAPPEPAEGEKFLRQYFQLMRRHDMAGLSALIADDSKVEVLFMDSDPPMKFTLAKGDYLQQLKALWHFSREEDYSIGPVRWQADAGSSTLQASLQETETRLLLENRLQQVNDLELRLGRTANGLRITGIRTTTRMQESEH